VLTGVESGFIVGSASWAYYMFQFTKHVVRRQMQMKEEQSRRTEYIRTYFKDKYQLQE